MCYTVSMRHGKLKIILAICCVLAAALFFVLAHRDQAQINSIDASKENARAFLAVASVRQRTASGVVWQARLADDASYGDAYAVYTAPEGFALLSMSETWTAEKLRALYDVFMENQTGSELSLLREIVLYGEDDPDALGSEQASSKSIHLHLAMGGLPNGVDIALYTFSSVIELYGCDTSDTPELLAATLAHEYGHLFTDHYFFDGLSNEEILSCDYVKARGLLGNENLLSDYSDYDVYLENHAWYVQEIAADDYMQLLSGGTARQIYMFPDTLDQLYADMDGTPIASPYLHAYDAYNAYPRENILIPLADEVDGLYAFFAEQLGKTDTRAVADCKVALSIKEQTHSFDLTEGRRCFTYYELRWAAQTGCVLYTLLCYDAEGNLYFPVKTVLENERRVATIGCVPVEDDDYVYWYDDGLSGVLTFRVTMLLSDGRIAMSAPLVYDFGGEQ